MSLKKSLEVREEKRKELQRLYDENAALPKDFDSLVKNGLILFNSDAGFMISEGRSRQIAQLLMMGSYEYNDKIEISIDNLAKLRDRDARAFNFIVDARDEGLKDLLKRIAETDADIKRISAAIARNVDKKAPDSISVIGLLKSLQSEYRVYRSHLIKEHDSLLDAKIVTMSEKAIKRSTKIIKYLDRIINSLESAYANADKLLSNIRKRSKQAPVAAAKVHAMVKDVVERSKKIPVSVFLKKKSQPVTKKRT